MRKLKSHAVLEAASGQQSLAAELGIEHVSNLPVDTLVERIEQGLGDKALLESTRWFVMSVVRHLSKDVWHELADSGVDTATQYALAQECLLAPGFVQSLRTVLKNAACKFALVEFRRTRNPAKRILSSSTLAYQCAEQIVRQVQARQSGTAASLIEPPPAAGAEPVVTQVATAPVRRAQRRGLGLDAAGRETADHAGPDPGVCRPDAQLSPQEVADLEQALGKERPTPGPHQWFANLGADEGRSWLLGALAGLVVFAIFLFVVM